MSSPCHRHGSASPAAAAELLAILAACPRFAAALASNDPQRVGDAVLMAQREAIARTRARELPGGPFAVSCSQCGRDFRRPAPNGFSHCEDHELAFA